MNFLHNVISLNELLQHLKHAAQVYLTLMSKYFSLTHYFRQCLKKHSDLIKQCRPRSDCFSRSSLIRDYTFLHFGHPTAAEVHIVLFYDNFNNIFQVFQLLELLRNSTRTQELATRNKFFVFILTAGTDYQSSYG